MNNNTHQIQPNENARPRPSTLQLENDENRGPISRSLRSVCLCEPPKVCNCPDMLKPKIINQ